MQAIADGVSSDTLRDTLRRLEGDAKTEQRELAALERSASTPVDLPTLEEATLSLDRLRELLEVDPVAGRERLRSLFRDGRIAMDAESGELVLRGVVYPLKLLENPTPDGGRGPDLRTDGSGGTISTLYSAKLLGFFHNGRRYEVTPEAQ